MFVPQLLASDAVFVYGWRDVLLALLVAALFLFIGGVYAWAWVSVRVDKLRARFKKKDA